MNSRTPARSQAVPFRALRPASPPSFGPWLRHADPCTSKRRGRGAWRFLAAALPLLAACGPSEEAASRSVEVQPQAREATRNEVAPPAASLAAATSADPAVSCPTIAWSSDITAAIDRSKQENKPVLVAFSARQQEPGCGDEF